MGRKTEAKPWGLGGKDGWHLHGAQLYTGSGGDGAAGGGLGSRHPERCLRLQGIEESLIWGRLNSYSRDLWKENNQLQVTRDLKS